MLSPLQNNAHLSEQVQVASKESNSGSHLEVKHALHDADHSTDLDATLSELSESSFINCSTRKRQQHSAREYAKKVQRLESMQEPSVDSLITPPSESKSFELYSSLTSPTVSSNQHLSESDFRLDTSLQNTCVAKQSLDGNKNITAFKNNDLLSIAHQTGEECRASSFLPISLLDDSSLIPDPLTLTSTAHGAAHTERPADLTTTSLLSPVASSPESSSPLLVPSTPPLLPTTLSALSGASKQVADPQEVSVASASAPCALSSSSASDTTNATKKRRISTKKAAIKQTRRCSTSNSEEADDLTEYSLGNIKKAQRPSCERTYLFLWELLHEAQFNPSIIKWVDKSQLLFEIQEGRSTQVVAQLWAIRKGRNPEEATWENFSRAIRYSRQRNNGYFDALPPEHDSPNLRRQRMFRFGPRTLENVRANEAAKLILHGVDAL